jgi:hypothetical protein
LEQQYQTLLLMIVLRLARKRSTRGGQLLLLFVIDFWKGEV